MIDYARFANVGPFIESEFRFSPYVNAIVGPNGSGKSTLVNGIYAAHTNDFSRFPENKANLIRLDTDRKAESYIEIGGTHKYQDYVVRRYLQGGRSFFKCRDVYVEGEDDVTRSVMEFLDVDLGIMDSCVFVAQSDIQSFLSMKPAARKKFLNSIYGLDFFEGAYDALHKTLNTINLLPTIDVTGVKDKLDAAESKAIEFEAAIAKANSDLKTVDIESIKADLSYYLSNETKQSSYTTACAKLDLLLNQQKEKELELKDSLMSLEDADKNFEALDARHALVAEQICINNAKIASNAKILAYDESIAKIKIEIAQREAIVNAFTEADKLRFDYLSELMAKLQRTVDGAAEFSAHVTEADAACNFCGTDIADVSKALDRSKERWQQAKDQLELYHSEFHRLAVAKQARDTNSELLKVNQSELEKISAAKAAVVIIEPQLSSEACVEFMTRHNSARTAAYNAKTKYDIALSAYNKLSEDIKKATADRDSIEFGEDFKQLDPAALREQIASYDQTVKNIKDWEVHLSTNLKPMVAEYRTILDKAADVEAENVKRHAAINYLSNLKTICKYDCMPQQLSQEFLAEDCVDVNSYLDILKADFNIASNEKLEFSICFKGGKSHSEARLSPGQKTILAIAFLLAFNKKYAKDVRIMSLDEPTIWLDSERIKHLGVIISKMSEISRSESIQYLVISHDDSLIQDADNVICTL